MNANCTKTRRRVAEVAIAIGGMQKGVKRAASSRPMEQLIDTVERVHISLGPDLNGGISGRKACGH